MIAGHRCTGRYIVAIIVVFLLLSFMTLGWLRKHRMKVLERPALVARDLRSIAITFNDGVCTSEFVRPFRIKCCLNSTLSRTHVNLSQSNACLVL